MCGSRSPGRNPAGSQRAVPVIAVARCDVRRLLQRDQVRVLRMPLDVRAHVRTGWYDVESATPRFVERERRQLPGDAAPPELLGDLGVDQPNDARLLRVTDDAHAA